MTRTPINDIEIVAQVLAGDVNAYAELVRRHHGRIMALCVSMLSDSEAAEDVAQETFIKAYQSLKNFRAESSLPTWLYRIAANRCLDLKRKLAREKSQSLDVLLEDNAEAIQKLTATPGPERSLEDVELVRKVLSCLPEQYRLILTLREINGLNYQEVAAAMSCSLDSVKARLRRARQEFLQRLRHFAAAKDV